MGSGRSNPPATASPNRYDDPQRLTQAIPCRRHQKRSRSGLVLPFGVTLNVNGTAVFQAVALVFLAQLFGVELGLGMQMALTAQVVGLILIGAPGIPGGSLPPLVAVLGVAGVPPVGIAVILGVDRLLDMGRTALNVVGDLSASLYAERVHSGRPAAIPAD